MYLLIKYNSDSLKNIKELKVKYM